MKTWKKIVLNTLAIGGSFIAGAYFLNNCTGKEYTNETNHTSVFALPRADTTSIDTLVIGIDSTLVSGDYINAPNNQGTIYINSPACCPDEEKKVISSSPAKSTPKSQVRIVKEPVAVVDSTLIKKYDRLMEIHRETLDENNELYRKNKLLENQEIDCADPFSNVQIDIYGSKGKFFPTDCNTTKNK